MKHHPRETWLFLLATFLPALLMAQSQRDLALEGLRNAESARSFRGLVMVETLDERGEPNRLEFDLFSYKGREILRYRAPVRDRGKLILQIGGSYWMYFPAVQRSLTLSPIGSLAGGVSNGDLLAPPLLTLYTLVEEKQIPEGIRLTLDATDLTAPYGRVVADFQDGKMIRADFFTRAKIHVKHAEYLDHRYMDWGSWIATEVLITPIIGSGDESRILMEGLENAELPAFWFNPNNLGRVR